MSKYFLKIFDIRTLNFRLDEMNGGINLKIKESKEREHRPTFIFQVIKKSKLSMRRWRFASQNRGIAVELYPNCIFTGFLYLSSG